MTKADRPLVRTATLYMLATALLTIAAGCSHMPHPHWPWHHKAEQPPEVVHELVITTPEGAEAAFPQYWKRNTLIVNMQSASGEGSIVLKPREHTVWGESGNRANRIDATVLGFR